MRNNLKLPEWMKEAWKDSWGLWLVLLIALLIGIWQQAQGQEFDSNTQTCDNCLSESYVWEGQVDVFLNDDNSPFPRDEVAAEIQWVLDYFNLYIEWNASYSGTSSMVPVWMPDSTRGNTIIVTFGEDTMGFDAFATVWALEDGRLENGEVTIRPSVPRECLRGYLLHEFMHLLDVPHTSYPHSIMTVPYHDCAYQATLRLYDIERLQEKYPSRPNRQGVITSYVEGQYICNYQPEVTEAGITAEVSWCVAWQNMRAIVHKGGL